jgi:hypothetical protein
MTASLIGSPPLPSIKSPTSKTVSLSCATAAGTPVKQARAKNEIKSHMLSSRRGLNDYETFSTKREKCFDISKTPKI